MTHRSRIAIGVATASIFGAAAFGVIQWFQGSPTPLYDERVTGRKVGALIRTLLEDEIRKEADELRRT